MGLVLKQNNSYTHYSSTVACTSFTNKPTSILTAPKLRIFMNLMVRIVDITVKSFCTARAGTAK